VLVKETEGGLDRIGVEGQAQSELSPRQGLLLLKMGFAQPQFPEKVELVVLMRSLVQIKVRKLGL
jgi:hypothetical protein